MRDAHDLRGAGFLVARINRRSVGSVFVVACKELGTGWGLARNCAPGGADGC